MAVRLPDLASLFKMSLSLSYLINMTVRIYYYEGQLLIEDFLGKSQIFSFQIIPFSFEKSSVQ